jgi:hypothetical protein
MGRACSKYGEKCIEGFGWETWRKETLGRPKLRWEVYIKIGLQEVGWVVCSGFIWLKVGTGGRNAFKCGN